MGKKSKKKAGPAPQQRQQQQNANGSNATTTSSTMPVTTVANASATMVESEQEPSAEFDMDTWERRFPFAEKTSDPQAKDLDIAHELFRRGLDYAKNNDWYVAAEHISSAYVRDKRVVIIDHEGNDKRVLHPEVFMTMLNNAFRDETEAMPLTSGLLFLILAMKRQSLGQSADTQMLISSAMGYMDVTLDVGSEHEELLETTTVGQLGGLTLAKVHYLRGCLYMELYNGRSAIKDLTKALKLDPSLADARLLRLFIWEATECKTHAEIHAECEIFLGLVHEDYSEIDVVYALLAGTTFVDPRLGTYIEAMEYYRKSLQATKRRVELYGPRSKPYNIISRFRKDMKAPYEDPEGDEAKKRKICDTAEGRALMHGGGYFDQLQCVDKTKRNMCLHCKKYEEKDNDIQLRKCSRCKRVYYCSTECVRANWKEHKWFCHAVSKYKSSET